LRSSSFATQLAFGAVRVCFLAAITASRALIGNHGNHRGTTGTLCATFAIVGQNGMLIAKSIG
jgi:hypothetical protein